MAFIVGPSDGFDSPVDAVLRMLRAPGLRPEHVQVEPAPNALLPGYTDPVFTWTLTPESPPFLGEDVVMVEGVRGPGGYWRPTGVQGPESLPHGIAVETEHGWVVAATSAEGQETVAALTEQVLAHVALLDDLEAPPGRPR